MLVLDSQFEGFDCFHGSTIIKNNELRHGRHCVFALHVHLVFVTKYRRGVFKAEHMAAMQRIMASICKDFEAQLVEFNGEADYVHLLVNYPPKVALSVSVWPWHLEAGRAL